MNWNRFVLAYIFTIPAEMWRNDQAPIRVLQNMSEQRVTERDFVITKPCISMGNDTRIDHLPARRKQSDEPPTAISCASCDIYRLSRWLDLEGWLQVIPVGLRYMRLENRWLELTCPARYSQCNILSQIPTILNVIFEEEPFEKMLLERIRWNSNEVNWKKKKKYEKEIISKYLVYIEN